MKELTKEKIISIISEMENIISREDITSEQLLSCSIIIDDRYKNIQKLAEGRALCLNKVNLNSVNGKGHGTLYCSFCGASQHEVKRLVAGPGVNICNDCVELCRDIIDGD